jgi:type II secretory pathway pseudopilin PulG
VKTTRSGFTLLDALLALVLLAVILSVVYAVFFAQEKARRAAEESRDVFGQGLVAVERLRMDLVGAWLPETGGGTGPAYRFETVENGLDFTTSSSLSPTEAGGPDLVEVGYRLEETENEGLNLVRRQDDTPDEDAASGGRSFILCRRVVSLELKYLGDDGAEAALSSARSSGEMPAQVRIRLVLADPNNRPHAFQTLVSIPLRRSAIPLMKTPTQVPSS